MCGGSDKHSAPEPVSYGGHDTGAQPAAYNGTYTAPDLKSLYSQFQQSGTVPYSYYGQGAPTDPAELARVQAAYPGAFKPNEAPAPRHGQGQGNYRPERGQFHQLISSFTNRQGGNWPKP